MDRDLASLYGVTTSQLKRQVRRNLDRFPDDFMFELTKAEYEELRCQSGILKRGQHAKYLPFAFTEQGVAMLSSVLGSKEAIHVSICIMRAFVRMREMMLKHAEFSALVNSVVSRNQRAAGVGSASVDCGNHCNAKQGKQMRYDDAARRVKEGSFTPTLSARQDAASWWNCNTLFLLQLSSENSLFMRQSGSGA